MTFGKMQRAYNGAVIVVGAENGLEMDLTWDCADRHDLQDQKEQLRLEMD